MKFELSFKKTTRDMRLYTIVKGQEEQSEFIKKAIEFYVNYLEEQKNKSTKNE